MEPGKEEEPPKPVSFSWCVGLAEAVPRIHGRERTVLLRRHFDPNMLFHRALAAPRPLGCDEYVTFGIRDHRDLELGIDRRLAATGDMWRLS
jgi:hypothetical protein